MSYKIDKGNGRSYVVDSLLTRALCLMHKQFTVAQLKSFIVVTNIVC